jgi:signal transduction histidine kinase
LIAIAALAFFARRDRRYGMAALGLLLVNLGWLLFLINKSPRYLAMLSPLFAIALAYFAAKTASGRYRKLVAAAVALVLLTQVGGNAFWLYRYRHANYAEVSRQLRSIVPPGASVYGIITFWMALHDRTYYAYDRTELDPAVTKLRPQFMILYDRVMMHGSGYGDNWAPLRAQATEFVRRHGTLAGRVANDFYGDLEIYRISY